MGYALGVRGSMMIAHSFKGEGFGPAQKLHGATYVVDCEFRTESLVPEMNWVIDIGKATNILNEVLALYNYKNLDEIDKFKGQNTTTEFMCRQVFDEMSARVRDFFKDGPKILSEAGVKQLSATKAFECSILRFEHISKTLQSLPAKFSLIVPPSSNSILLWLSGLTCTDENFVIKAGAARYAKEYNVVIACPDTSPRGANAPEESTSWDFGTGAGFYVDATCEGYEAYQMSSYVMSEFVPLIKQMIGLDQKIGISGHSMGGMGALQFAFRFPHVFASVSAFAPISHPSIVPWGQKCFGKYLGEENNNSGEAEESSTWKLYDPAMIIRKVGKKFEDVLVHQGSEDQFLEEQLKPDELVKACEEVGQKLTLHMAQGYDHSYYFVQTFIGEHIKYHVEAMSSS